MGLAQARPNHFIVILCLRVSYRDIIDLILLSIVDKSTWKYDHGRGQEHEITLKGSIGTTTTTTTATTTTVKIRHAKPPRQIYEMNGKPRHGVALIINNTFEKSSRRSHRVGTENDADNLTTTFEFLGYEVIVWENCSHIEMKNITFVLGAESPEMKDSKRKRSSNDVDDHDSFVCCILSHGTQGHIKSNDDALVTLNDIVEPLLDYEHLNDKPKMFFIQACRGSKDRKKITDKSSQIVEGHRDDDGNDAKELKIPKVGADFFFGYATLPGFVAHRSNDGSPYIKLLCKTLCERGRHTNLVTMHTMLNHDVATNIIREDKTQYLQISEFEDSLRNFVYFYKQPRK